MVGAKGPESLENLFLNTNFLSLLEEGGVPKELVTLMETRGTHTAEVDAMLNSYMSEFIQTGKLKLERMPTAGMPPSLLSEEAAREYLQNETKIQETLNQHGFVRKNRSLTAFEKFMRQRIRRSGAVTPITNVSDVARLSEESFNYLLETEPGRQKISLAVDRDYAARMGLPTSFTSEIDGKVLTSEMDESAVGKLFYNKKANRYQMSVGGATENVEKSIAEAAIQDTLREARQGRSLSVGVPFGAAGQQNIGINPGTERIANVAMSEIEQTELDQMRRARSLGAGTVSAPSTKDEVLRAVGTTREFYGSDSSGYSQILAAEAGTTPGSLKTAEFAQTLAQRGLPYASLDARSRVLATAEASATSEIGARMLSLAGDTRFQKLASAETLSDLSDYGIQFMMAQGKEGRFGFKSVVGGRVITPNENSYFRTPILGTTKRASRVFMTADDLMKLKFRTFDDSGSAISEIAFGSKEFIESSELNRFVDSFVQNNSSEKILNRALSIKNQSRATMEDLADQVISLNIRKI